MKPNSFELSSGMFDESRDDYQALKAAHAALEVNFAQVGAIFERVIHDCHKRGYIFYPESYAQAIADALVIIDKQARERQADELKP